MVEQFETHSQRYVHTFPHVITRVPAVAALFAFAVGAISLVGSQLGIHSLYAFPAGFPALVPNASAGFMILAASLFLLDGKPMRHWFALGRVCAWIVILLGAGTAFEYLVSRQFQFDRIFAVPLELATGGGVPGQMVLMTAVNFVLVGSALLNLDGHSRSGQMSVSQTLALFALLGPFVSLLSFGLGLRNVQGFGPYALLGIIPLPSALVWLALVAGILCSRLDVGVMKTLTQATAASYSLRRILLPIVFVPPFIVGMMEFGVHKFLYVSPFGSAVLAVSTMLFVTVVIWKTVSGMQVIEEREKAARAARMRSDSELSSLFEVAPFGLVQADVSTLLFSRVNETFCAMTGYSQDELLKMTFAEITFEDDFILQWPGYQQIIANGGGQLRAEKRYMRKDGSILWVMVSGVVHKDPIDQTLRATAVIQDITQRKQEEQFLLDARSAADAANQMKSTFLANMSHELRTPLSAVTGFAELLLSEDLQPAERTAYLNAIRRNGKALSRLIDDVLDLTKVEAGKIEVEKVKVSVSAIVLDVRLSLEPLAREKGIELRSKLVGEVPEVMITDPNRLRQILLNVVGNAIKFTDKGGVDLIVKYPSSLESTESRNIEFWVHDTGKGLRQHEQERIFKPFSQADATTTRRFGGTGLGLALSRQLARALGGDVTLDSSDAQFGSVFLIKVPVGEVKQLDKFNDSSVCVMAADVQGRFFEAHSLDGASILLAEDAPDVQLLVKTILMRMGAKVTVASNGREAIDGAITHNVDLVLMDVQMPEVDGYGATRILRERGFNRPIIALTANAMKEDFERSIQAGCNGHLTKPISIEALGAVLQQHVSQAEPPRKSGTVSLQ